MHKIEKKLCKEVSSGIKLFSVASGFSTKQKLKKDLVIFLFLKGELFIGVGSLLNLKYTGCLVFFLVFERTFWNWILNYCINFEIMFHSKATKSIVAKFFYNKHSKKQYFKESLKLLNKIEIFYWFPRLTIFSLKETGIV